MAAKGGFESFADPALPETLRRLAALPTGPSGSGTLICDDFSVVYLGYRVPLTPAETAVLRCLWERRGTAGPADAAELLECCVGDAYRSPANVVQHIYSVNARLRAVGGRTVIRRSARGAYYVGGDI